MTYDASLGRAGDAVGALKGRSARAPRGSMTGPLGPAGGASIEPEVMSDLAARAARSDFARFEAQLRSSGFCARPVRLVGHVERCDGRGRQRVWSTDTEPDGILRKACG